MKSAVDIVNFFLIWITLGLAMAWPFELFLFSYIVLGPLHYLTEINWLDKQHYFLRAQDRRVFVWGMGGLVFLLTASLVIGESSNWQWTRAFHDAILSSSSGPANYFTNWSWSLLLVAFVTAAACLFTQRWDLRLVIIGFCLLSSFFFYAVPTVAILFGIFLPTIVHVFLFTVLFMIYGSLKARSFWGWANIASMFLVIAVIAVFPRTVSFNSVSSPVMQLFQDSAFLPLNFNICKCLGLTIGGQVDFYSPVFFKVQAFIAFAYTYHYLNWFSKTSIIKWHQVEKGKFVISIILWAASIALYAVDFRLGFAAIFALSILHVVLEFPLNFVSIRSISAAVAAKLKESKAASA
ncbi:MAG TPA: hypothetical protein VH280_02070 [Verrucomicrobiae bacterium]|jgi:hypothetical protein|nr:hypothetical protein [Verrucomicrobiae bacterium]